MDDAAPATNTTPETLEAALAALAEVTRERGDLGINASTLGVWVERARADLGKSKHGTLTTSEREELARLRKENRELKSERDILKKFAAFSARQLK